MNVSYEKVWVLDGLEYKKICFTCLDISFLNITTGMELFCYFEFGNILEIMQKRYIYFFMFIAFIAVFAPDPTIHQLIASL